MLIRQHLNPNAPKDLSFALWDEVPASEGCRSQQLWQLGAHGVGRISQDVSRMYFVNVGLPEGRRRWYTVVTVKNGECEAPFAIGQSM